MLGRLWGAAIVSVILGLSAGAAFADRAAEISVFRGAGTPQSLTLSRLSSGVADLSILRQNAKGLATILYPLTDYEFSVRTRTLKLASPMREGELLIVVPTDVVPQVCGAQADRPFGILMQGCPEALVRAAEAHGGTALGAANARSGARSAPRGKTARNAAVQDTARPAPSDNNLAKAAFVHVLTETTGLPGVPDNMDDWAGPKELHPNGGRRNEQVVTVMAEAGSPVLTSMDPLIAGVGADTEWPAVIQWPDGTFSFVLIDGVTGRQTLTLRSPVDVSGPGTLGPLFSSRQGQHLTRIGTEAYAWMVARRPMRDAVKGRRLLYHGANKSALTGPPDAPIGTSMWSLTSVSAQGPKETVNGIRLGAMVTRRLNPWRKAHGRTYLARPTVDRCGVEVGTHAQWEGVETVFTLNGKGARFEAFIIADDGDAKQRKGRPLALAMLVDAQGETVAQQWVGDHLTRVTFDIPASLGSGRILVVNPGPQQGGEATAYTIGVFNAGIWENEVDPARPLIGPGETWVTIGDSWFTWYDEAFPNALAKYSAAEAVVNYSQGGQKAVWAVREFDAILSTYPDADGFLVQFAINDLNDAVKDFSSPEERREAWLTSLAEFTRLAEARGIRVAIMMPPVTASRSQTSLLQKWAAPLFVGP